MCKHLRCDISNNGLELERCLGDVRRAVGCFKPKKLIVSNLKTPTRYKCPKARAASRMSASKTLESPTNAITAGMNGPT